MKGKRACSGIQAQSQTPSSICSVPGNKRLRSTLSVHITRTMVCKAQAGPEPHTVANNLPTSKQKDRVLRKKTNSEAQPSLSNCPKPPRAAEIVGRLVNRSIARQDPQGFRDPPDLVGSISLAILRTSMSRRAPGPSRPQSRALGRALPTTSCCSTPHSKSFWTYRLSCTQQSCTQHREEEEGASHHRVSTVPPSQSS